MANLPTTRRITQEELQGEPEQQIETMVRPINLFFESLYTALNKDLTVQENMDAQVTTVRFKVPEDYPSLDAWVDINFQLEMKRTPSGAHVLHLEEVDNLTEVHDQPVWADVKFIPGEASIKYITGVQPCRSYNITLLIL